VTSIPKKKVVSDVGSSNCEICNENDYLDEYSLVGMDKNIYVCRNCVEEGLRLRIKELSDEQSFNVETFEAKGYAPDKPYYATTHENWTSTVMHPIKCGHYKMVMGGNGVWRTPTFYDTIEEMFTAEFDNIISSQYEGMMEWAMCDPDGKEPIRKYKDIKTIADARKFAKKNFDYKIDFAPCFRKESDFDSKALNALPITVHPFWIDDGGWSDEHSDALREFQADAEYNVEFNEWADQEMNSHGKNISFKDWAEDEGMKHGNSEITDWAEHEDESHDARYGAEELKKDSCCCGATKSNPCACMIQGIETCSATCPCSLEKKGAETYEDSWEKGVIRLAISSGCFNDEYAEWVERQIDGPNATLNNPRYKEIIDKRWGLNAENWGGDPEGKLALALQKARDKAKEPRKPLKIEKLEAETFEGIPKSVSDLESLEDVRADKYEMEVNFENEDIVIVSGAELKAIIDDGWYLDSVRSFADAGMSLLFTRNPYHKAETSGQWEIGEQLDAEIDGEELIASSANFGDGSMIVGVGTETLDVDNPDFMEMMIDKDGKIEYFTLPIGLDGWDRHYNVKPSHYGKMKTQNETNESTGGDFIRTDGDGKYAESFSAPTKGIDTFAKPFEESSLDSGTVKSVLVGLGIGALALFGYNKWK